MQVAGFVVHSARCDRCLQRDHSARSEEERRARSARLFDASGIPEKYRRHRLDRIVLRRPAEPWDAFAARVRAMEPPTLGVTTTSAPAMLEAQEWRHGHGSLYLEGNVGGGKTLVACSLAAAAMRAGVSVLYLRESALWEAVRERNGSAVAIAKQAVAVDLLVWDDWSTTQKPVDWQREIVEDIIGRRYDAVRPLIATSNIPLEGAESRWGARVASRLTEMVGQRQISLVDHDWRTGAVYGGAAP